MAKYFGQQMTWEQARTTIVLPVVCLIVLSLPYVFSGVLYETLRRWMESDPDILLCCLFSVMQVLVAIYLGWISVHNAGKALNKMSREEYMGLISMYCMLLVSSAVKAHQLQLPQHGYEIITDRLVPLVGLLGVALTTVRYHTQALQHELQTKLAELDRQLYINELKNTMQTDQTTGENNNG